MSLKDRIQEDVKAAMRARDARRVGALRLVAAALKQKEVDERAALDDAAVLAVIEKMIRQRRESLAQFEKGGRADLAAQEKFEIEVLSAYLPQPLSEAELEAAVSAAIAEAGAASVRDTGKVMGLLKSRLAGRADMGRVSALVRARLGG
ncbi:MAG: GatB/YqeY domain-containing protein [Burkholderiales bacterium]|nr:GatB/YqeY domain-containing protein [Burkholderiales bacterium]